MRHDAGGEEGEGRESHGDLVIAGRDGNLCVHSFFPDQQGPSLDLRVLVGVDDTVGQAGVQADEGHDEDDRKAYASPQDSVAFLGAHFDAGALHELVRGDVPVAVVIVGVGQDALDLYGKVADCKRRRDVAHCAFVAHHEVFFVKGLGGHLVFFSHALEGSSARRISVAALSRILSTNYAPYSRWHGRHRRQCLAGGCGVHALDARTTISGAGSSSSSCHTGFSLLSSSWL
mmetsp:Transcript_11696/g.25490  ORF Transcript_11696/g.25490 Transcript_11696/m.25490 type:complete len:231 (-) Transcript_11696:2-694(-)